MIDMSQVKAGDQVRIRYSGIFETPEFQVVLGHTAGQQRVTNSDGRNFYFDSGFIEVIEHKKSFKVEQVVTGDQLKDLPFGTILRGVKGNSVIQIHRLYLKDDSKGIMRVGFSAVYPIDEFSAEKNFGSEINFEILHLPTG